MQRHHHKLQHLPYIVWCQANAFRSISDRGDCLPHHHNYENYNDHDHQPVLVAVERVERVVPVMWQCAARPVAGMQRHCDLVQYIPHTLRRQANTLGPVSDHSDCLPHHHNHNNYHYQDHYHH